MDCFLRQLAIKNDDFKKISEWFVKFLLNNEFIKLSEPKNKSMENNNAMDYEESISPSSTKKTLKRSISEANINLNLECLSTELANESVKKGSKNAIKKNNTDSFNELQTVLDGPSENICPAIKQPKNQIKKLGNIFNLSDNVGKVVAIESNTHSAESASISLLSAYNDKNKIDDDENKSENELGFENIADLKPPTNIDEVELPTHPNQISKVKNILIKQLMITIDEDKLSKKEVFYYINLGSVF